MINLQLFPFESRAKIYHEIDDERDRQEYLKSQGKFKYTCADIEKPDPECLSVIIEEVGEIGRALNDREILDKLKQEILQTAACCVAWLEKINNELIYRKK